MEIDSLFQRMEKHVRPTRARVRQTRSASRGVPAGIPSNAEAPSDRSDQGTRQGEHPRRWRCLRIVARIAARRRSVRRGNRRDAGVPWNGRHQEVANHRPHGTDVQRRLRRSC